jgi:flagellar basal-body rod protein FlgB
MNFDIGVLKLAGALSSYASNRQSLISQNIANSDTPGFKARDYADFGEIVADTTARHSGMRATRPMHWQFGENLAAYEAQVKSLFGSESPDGNTVTLEDQMIRSAEVKQQHDLALGIYSKSLAIMRASLGRR